MNVGGSPFPLNLSFKIIDGSGITHRYNATKQAAHEVVWVRFTVTAPATGACCNPDGTCTVASQTGCTNLIGGTYQGNGALCANVTCTQPPAGACCQNDGTCIIANSFSCNTYAGAYTGNGSVCAGANCPKIIITGTPGTAGGFGTAGAVFLNVTAPADHGVQVTRFDYQGTQAYNNVTFYPVIDIFVREEGTYVGNEFGACASAHQPNGWEFNTQVTINPYPVGGSDAILSVLLANPVTVPAGQTVGFYLVARAGGISASSSGPTSFTDGEVTVSSDEGRFATVTSPNWAALLSTSQQTFRGRVFYTAVVPLGACCCGSSCSITAAGACAGTNTAFADAGTTCIPYSLSAPCCRGDYNKAGGAAPTVQDIFDFLGGFFANSPCADTTDNGGISVQDIFDFLGAYFTGGC